jgi:hypothetical protein
LQDEYGISRNSVGNIPEYRLVLNCGCHTAPCVFGIKMDFLVIPYSCCVFRTVNGDNTIIPKVLETIPDITAESFVTFPEESLANIISKHQ